MAVVGLGEQVGVSVSWGRFPFCTRQGVPERVVGTLPQACERVSSTLTGGGHGACCGVCVVCFGTVKNENNTETHTHSILAKGFAVSLG